MTYKKRTTHTPGPWECRIARRSNCYEIIGPDNEGIADTGNWPEENMLENEGNARLIASAPEMLEALEEIAQGRGGFSKDNYEFAKNVIENMKALAEAAIARAKGEA